MYRKLSQSNDSILKHNKKKYATFFFLFFLLAFIFEYARIQDSLIPILGNLKIVAICKLVLLLFVLKEYNKEIVFDKQYKLFFIFTIYVGATILWATNHHFVYRTFITFLWMTISFFLPLRLLLNSTDILEKLVFAWVLVHTYIAIYVLTHSGIGPGGIVEDENDVALCLTMGLPFAFYYHKLLPKAKFKRLSRLVFASIIVLAILYTKSRGGLVALVACVLTLTALSNRPIKNLSILVLLALTISTSFIIYLPEDYVKDVANITNPEDATASERLYSWSIGLYMFLDNPVLGVGAANYPWTNHLYAELSPLWDYNHRSLAGRAAHSAHISLVSELGLVGVLLFSYLTVNLLKQSAFLVKFDNSDTDRDIKFMINFLGKAFIASAMAYFLGATFISVLYYPFFWYLVAFVSCSFSFIKENLANE
jgi:O-antigen ligase